MKYQILNKSKNEWEDVRKKRMKTLIPKNEIWKIEFHLDIEKKDLFEINGYTFRLKPHNSETVDKYAGVANGILSFVLWGIGILGIYKEISSVLITIDFVLGMTYLVSAVREQIKFFVQESNKKLIEELKQINNKK